MTWLSRILHGDVVAARTGFRWKVEIAGGTDWLAIAWLGFVLEIRDAR